MNSKGFSCCFWIIFLHQHSLPTVPGAGNVPPKVSCDVGLRGGKMAHINSAKIFTIHFGKLFTAIVVSRHGLYWHKTFLLPLIIWLRQKSWEQKPSLFSPSIIGCAKIEMFAGNGISFHTTSGIQWTPNYHVFAYALAWSGDYYISHMPSSSCLLTKNGTPSLPSRYRFMCINEYFLCKSAIW